MKTKKLISLILALALIFGISIPGFAGEDYGVMPCYNYVSVCTAGITRNGSSVTVSTSATTDMGYTVSATVVLESSPDGEDDWSPEGTYYPTVTNTLGVHTAMKTINNVDGGLYYRGNVTLRIYDSHGRRLETVEIPSNVIYVP